MCTKIAIEKGTHKNAIRDRDDPLITEMVIIWQNFPVFVYKAWLCINSTKCNINFIYSWKDHHLGTMFSVKYFCDISQGSFT